MGGGLPTMVKFNPASFRIHAYREFTIANIMQETASVVEDEDVAVTNTFNALKRCRIRFRTNTKIKPPQGTWREMQESEIMPLDRKYLEALFRSLAFLSRCLVGVLFWCLFGSEFCIF